MMEFLGLLARPEIWLVAGVLLVIAEIFTGTIFSLALGLAALLTAAIAWLDGGGYLPAWLTMTDWRVALLVLASSALITVPLMRTLFGPGARGRDVNDY